jgi:hypothetical protein
VGSGDIFVETGYGEEVWDVEQSEGGLGVGGNKIWSVKKKKKESQCKHVRLYVILTGLS